MTCSVSNLFVLCCKCLDKYTFFLFCLEPNTMDSRPNNRKHGLID